ncbi:MAG: hypothetical protein H8E66_08505 [Planctomycetes bacterium]|nr:hypothetical protein [Planctomycetota bacterium]
MAEENSHPQILASVQTGQAQLLIAAGEHEPALQKMNDLLTQVGSQLHHRIHARVRGVAATSHTLTGDFDAAEAILLQQEGSEKTTPHPLDRRRVARQLVTLYEAWGKLEEAARRREPSKQSHSSGDRQLPP